MGFEVYDYAGGLQDWANAGEELAGAHGGGRPALVRLTRDVPTLDVAATVDDARSTMGDADFLLVVDDDRIVLGKVLARSLEQEGVDGAAGVDSILIEGPTTVRPTESLPALLERMQQARTASVVVTSNQGELIGVLFTEDAQRVVEATEGEHDHGSPHRH